MHPTDAPLEGQVLLLGRAVLRSVNFADRSANDIGNFQRFKGGRESILVGVWRERTKRCRGVSTFRVRIHGRDSNAKTKARAISLF